MDKLELIRTIVDRYNVSASAAEKAVNRLLRKYPETKFEEGLAEKVFEDDAFWN